MARQLGASNWSAEFLALLNNKSKTLNIHQYDFCVGEYKAVHEKRTLKFYVLAIIFFVAGLLAVAGNSPFMAVLLLALAANFNRQSADHILFAELLESQRLLAMLINSQLTQLPEAGVGVTQSHAAASDHNV